mmetsp:Transcript_13715/g.31655  ORF Transcript_13715/g.31655 Transcript_13715/m.31655 type:complete len:422 (-) Transcript_13715:318-1583(-)
MSQGKLVCPASSSRASIPKSKSWLPNTEALMLQALRIGTMCLPLVTVLSIEGLKASPEKSTTGFSSNSELILFTKRAAPPTGSCVLASISYTSLKCRITISLAAWALVGVGGASGSWHCMRPSTCGEIAKFDLTASVRTLNLETPRLRGDGLVPGGGVASCSVFASRSMLKWACSIVGMWGHESASLTTLQSLNTSYPSLPSARYALVATRYSRPVISMLTSLTLTESLSTRWPAGLVPSKLNETPDTCGNRPSILGHWLTPFSSARISCSPVSPSTVTSSIIGSSRTRSFIRSGPAGMMASARSVPEFRMVISAAQPSRMTSATKLPQLVSCVRIIGKRQSRSTAVVPTCSSIFALSVFTNPSTTAATSGSSSMLESISMCSVVMRGRSSALPKDTFILVMSRKSTPLLTRRVGPNSLTA